MKSIKMAVISPEKPSYHMHKIVKSLNEYEFLKEYNVSIDEYSNGEIIYYIPYNYDILYIVAGYASSYELRILKFINGINIPIIYGLHNPLFPYFIYRPKVSIFAIKSVLRFFLLLNLRRKQNFIVHTLNSYEYNIVYKLNFNSFLLPPGVDTELFKPREKDERMFTIFFSGLNYRKGADIVLDLLRSLNNTDIKFRIIITYGAVPFQSFIDEINRLKNKSSNIEISIYDYLDRRRLAEIISQSHVTLFPSKLETWGRIVLESIAAGVPVIGFDIPGAMHDVVKRFGCGFAVKPFCYKCLLKALLYVYRMYNSYPEKYYDETRKCREISLRYDIRIISKRMYEYIKKLLIISNED